jgi:hypothetical protein
LAAQTREERALCTLDDTVEVIDVLLYLVVVSSFPSIVHVGEAFFPRDAGWPLLSPGFVRACWVGAVPFSLKRYFSLASSRQGRPRRKCDPEFLVGF